VATNRGTGKLETVKGGGGKKKRNVSSFTGRKGSIPKATGPFNTKTKIQHLRERKKRSSRKKRHRENGKRTKCYLGALNADSARKKKGAPVGCGGRGQGPGLVGLITCGFIRRIIFVRCVRESGSWTGEKGEKGRENRSNRPEVSIFRKQKQSL